MSDDIERASIGNPEAEFDPSVDGRMTADEWFRVRALDYAVARHTRDFNLKEDGPSPDELVKEAKRFFRYMRKGT